MDKEEAIRVSLTFRQIPGLEQVWSEILSKISSGQARADLLRQHLTMPSERVIAHYANIPSLTGPLRPRKKPKPNAVLPTIGGGDVAAPVSIQQAPAAVPPLTVANAAVTAAVTPAPTVVSTAHQRSAVGNPVLAPSVAARPPPVQTHSSPPMRPAPAFANSSEKNTGTAAAFLAQMEERKQEPTSIRQVARPLAAQVSPPVASSPVTKVSVTPIEKSEPKSLAAMMLKQRSRV